MAIVRRTLTVRGRLGPVKVVDFAGKQFGNLTVLRYVGRSGGVTTSHYWEASCGCGEKIIVKAASLTNGNSKSCGCIREQNRQSATVSHGATRNKYKIPEYQAWGNMIARCEQASAANFHCYGGRGISVCHRWREGDGHNNGYDLFVLDMGRRPSKLFSLDRIDVNGNYEPGNCRWADSKTQNRNRTNNIWVMVNGEQYTITDARRLFGVSHTTYYRHLRRGLTCNEAFALAAERPVCVSFL